MQTETQNTDWNELDPDLSTTMKADGTTMHTKIEDNGNVIRNIRIKSPSLEVLDESRAENHTNNIKSLDKPNISIKSNQYLSNNYHLKESAPILFDSHKK